MNLKRFPTRNPFSVMMILTVFVTLFSALPQTCTACDVATETSCQAYDGYGESSISDWGEYIHVADDFIPLSDTINSVCVWGTYVDNQLQSAPDCANQVIDTFHVIVNTNDLQSDIPSQRISRVSASVTRIPVEGSDDFEYRLELDEPITGLQLDGRKYWIDVSNDLRDFTDCNWAWSQVDPTNAGNQYSSQSIGAFHDELSRRSTDHAFCLDIDFATPDTPLNYCCTCSDGVCEMITLKECQGLDGQWYNHSIGCFGIQCTAGSPTNDSCLTPVQFTLDNSPYDLVVNSNCATTDGYNPIQTAQGDQSIENDMWYTYTTSIGCDLSLIVEFKTLYDSVIAVYTNGTSECPCPTDEQTHLQTFLLGISESYVEVDGFTLINRWFEVEQETCYLIRIGGDLAGASQGLGLLYMGESFGHAFYPPILADPDGPGSFDCAWGNPCMTCSAGSRSGELCLYDSDCEGGVCAPNDSLCDYGPCGYNMWYTEDPVYSAWPKDRYIGIQPDPYWWTVGIRVKLDDVKDHPECNGQYRWVGPPVEYCEDANCDTKLLASQLQGTPHFIDWSSYDAIQIYGEEIIPESQYSIQIFGEYYEDEIDNEYCYSQPTIFQTGKWGDVVWPFDRFTSSSQPSIADVLAIVDKWLGSLEPRKARAQLQPQIPNPDASVSIADVLKAVDAWLGTPYPYPIDSCVP